MASSRLALRAVQLESGSTTVKLEPEFWDILEEISVKERTKISMIITEIDRERGDTCLRASAIRVYILAYLRAAAKQTLAAPSSRPASAPGQPPVGCAVKLPQ